MRAAPTTAARAREARRPRRVARPPYAIPIARTDTPDDQRHDDEEGHGATRITRRQRVNPDDVELLVEGGRSSPERGAERRRPREARRRNDDQRGSRRACDERTVDSSAVDRVASGRFARVSRRPKRELLPDHHRQRRGTDDPGRHVVRLRIVKGADVREHEQRLHEEHDPDCHDQQRNPAETGRPLRRACHDGALLAHQHRGGLALEVHVRLAAVDDARSARLRLAPRRRTNASSGVDEARAATARTAGAILGGSHCNAPPSHRLRHRATDDHGARLQGKIGT